jgi:hypothetical protein
MVVIHSFLLNGLALLSHRYNYQSQSDLSSNPTDLTGMILINPSSNLHNFFIIPWYDEDVSNS